MLSKFLKFPQKKFGHFYTVALEDEARSASEASENVVSLYKDNDVLSLNCELGVQSRNEKSWRRFFEQLLVTTHFAKCVVRRDGEQTRC